MAQRLPPLIDGGRVAELADSPVRNPPDSTPVRCHTRDVSGIGSDSALVAGEQGEAIADSRCSTPLSGGAWTPFSTGVLCATRDR